MGPVSELGYSSAAPILEFAKANGQLAELSEGYNDEERSGDPSVLTKTKAGLSKYYGKAKRKTKSGIQKTGEIIKSDSGVGTAAAGAAGVAGLFGLYKLYKYYKSKKDTKNMEKVQAKIKAKKAKA